MDQDSRDHFRDGPGRAATLDWIGHLRVAALTSVIAALLAVLAVRTLAMQEQSVVLAVIIAVSAMSWAGLLDRPSRPDALPVQVRRRRDP